MSGFRARLAEGRPLLGDGALGTELFRRGLVPGQCPERWTLLRPDAVVDVARAYLEAGAEVIQTNTFGASPLRLAAFGLEGLTAELNARAVALTRATVAERAFVAGSVGPNGALLEPHGPARCAEVRASFEVQVAALAEAGVDVLQLETFMDLEEALLALEAAERVAPGLPATVTLSFEDRPEGPTTLMGNTPAEAAARLGAAGAVAVGANCGQGIARMAAVAQGFLAATALPVMIRANAGLPVAGPEGFTYPEGPAFFAEQALALIRAGVRVVGGCCGTTPAHIAAIRARLR